MKQSNLISTILGASTLGLAQKLSHADAQAQLEAGGVYLWSSTVCTEPVQGCTSYENINQATVDGAITLKASCGCDVIITGGTEEGHASGTYSHANGYKLDLQKNSGLDGYITGTFTRIEDRFDGYPQWEAASGNIYCDEGNHWDIIYYTCGC